jgi:8-oxo-dGTP diphosphatase
MMGNAKIAVGVSVLLINGPHILLGERINNTAAGLLSTPGGRVEEDEPLLDTAIRETEEETGLKLNKQFLKVVAWREHFRYGQHYIMFYVRPDSWTGSIENREPEKCKEWIWYRVDKLRQEETTEPLEILRDCFKE